MANEESQIEELNVLHSIYEGDKNFFVPKDNIFQYKIQNEDSEMKSFLVEIQWHDNYPECVPDINLDAFYNKHLSGEVKAHILQELMAQADELKGLASTYSVFEWAKENASNLLEKQPEVIVTQEVCQEVTKVETSTKRKDKKEQLSKAQKKKLLNYLDATGEKLRGWNWVDVVKHLLQTGEKQ